MNDQPNDNRRLDVALGARRPATNAEEITEVERLLRADQRRVSVDDHQAFRESLEPQPKPEDSDL